jgi:uncharacterized membrane protein
MEMENLKTLFIMLVISASALTVSIFLLALISAPDLAPLDLLFLSIVQGSPVDIPFFVLLAPLLFLTTVLASVVGMIYYFVLPEIKTYYEAGLTPPKDAVAQMVMKTLKQDEQKVIQVLRVHGGSYLQKYISKEAGLSKLRTHRIIARFSERGIVRVVRRGNTNEISLVDWFRPLDDE